MPVFTLFRSSRGLSVGILASVVVMQSGCSSSQPEISSYTGYLTSYRNLDPVSNSELRYRDPNNRLARYDKFMVDPVAVQFREGALGADTTPDDLAMLQEYMREALVDALDDQYQVVSAPAGDVGEVRVIITDVRQSSVLFTSAQVGGLAMEAEVIDSVSSVQIGALVVAISREGLRIENRFDRWADVKAVMDALAQRLRVAIDDAHDVVAVDAS